MSCYQVLVLNNNTGDLQITQGNTVNLVQAIQTFSIKTPVMDFSIAGNVISLYYKDATGALQIKTVTLPAAGNNNSAISVASTNTVLSSIASGVITSSVKLSAVSGNALVVNADGLFVSPLSAASIQIESTPSVSLTLQAGVLGAIANLSAQAGNTLTIVGDGLFVPANTLTPSQVRNLLSATAPIGFDPTTGIISISQAGTTTSGSVTSTDWNTFNNKLSGATTVSSASSTPVLKNVVSGTAQFRGVTPGTGIGVTLLGDDIVVSQIATVPVVSAGPPQTVANTVTTITMAGSASVASGAITATHWLLVTGPNAPVITDASSLTTTVTGLVPGAYIFRLIGIASTGLTSASTMSLTVASGSITLDTIYIGVQSGSTPPNAAAVMAGTSSMQNGANDVSADWTSLSASAPVYCWFAIPNNGGSYFKTKWFATSLNNGNIGGSTDTFSAYTQVTISSIVYNVSITAFATQFVNVVSLQA